MAFSKTEFERSVNDVCRIGFMCWLEMFWGAKDQSDSILRITDCYVAKNTADNKRDNITHLSRPSACRRNLNSIAFGLLAPIAISSPLFADFASHALKSGDCQCLISLLDRRLECFRVSCSHSGMYRFEYKTASVVGNGF